jgi:hypothetical protein
LDDALPHVNDRGSLEVDCMGKEMIRDPHHRSLASIC